MTGVEADVDTETTVRDPRPGNRSPTLQEVPTEPEPPASDAETDVGDWRTDALLNPPPPRPRKAGMPPPPPPPKAVTNLVLAPRVEAKRIPPKILNPGEAPRAGAPGEAPAGREGGIKARRSSAAVQDILGADARAKQIAQQRTRELDEQQRQSTAERLAANRASASAAEMTPAERQAAEQLELRRSQAIGAIGAPSGTRSPDGRLPGTPGRNPGTPGRQRRSSISPQHRERRRRG